MARRPRCSSTWLAYTVTNVGAFAALMLAGRRGAEAVSYDDLAGYARVTPPRASRSTFFLLSLIGSPRRWASSRSSTSSARRSTRATRGSPSSRCVNSAISAYYYLGVMVKMYMRDPAPGAVRAEPMDSPGLTLTLIASAAMVLALGLMPGRFYDYALEAVKLSVAPVAAAPAAADAPAAAPSAPSAR
jgi:NADH-quinone oxidoreductase subunit N